MRTQIGILFKECYSQRQIAKMLKIFRLGVQYFLQRQLETCANVDRKRAEAPKVIIAVKLLIIENKRHQRKSVPQWTAKLNSS